MLIQDSKAGCETRRSVAKKLKESILIVLVFFAIPCVCWGWQGRVAGVPCGDTISVDHDGKKETIRLYGIACPQIRQDFGQSAQQFTSDRVSGRMVDVDPVSAGQDGRTIGIVSINGLVLNRQLLEWGLAWVYEQGCRRPECPEWKNLEEQARFRRVGLWSKPAPVPPWQFRFSRVEASTVESVPTEAAAPAEIRNIIVYHGNTSSRMFHAPGCKFYDCIHCSVSFQSRDEALAAGYKPDRGCVK